MIQSFFEISGVIRFHWTLFYMEKQHNICIADWILHGVSSVLPKNTTETISLFQNHFQTRFIKHKEIYHSRTRRGCWGCCQESTVEQFLLKCRAIVGLLVFLYKSYNHFNKQNLFNRQLGRNCIIVQILFDFFFTMYFNNAVR